MQNQIPKIAFCYDFDGTLFPGNVLIKSLNAEINDIWEKGYQHSLKNASESMLSCMYALLKEAEKHKISFTRQTMREIGAEIKFYDGVPTWFDRINSYAAAKGLLAEHYIISANLEEIIKGTSISAFFKRIYASSFVYNLRGRPVWPARVLNYTTKTQYLFRINKGCLDINDFNVNSVISQKDRRIPFSQMVYIGDGLTDIPCMKIVKEKGGLSIAVYNPEVEKQVNIAHKLLNDERVNVISPCVYTPHSFIEKQVKIFIDKINAKFKKLS